MPVGKWEKTAFSANHAARNPQFFPQVARWKFHPRMIAPNWPENLSKSD
jgi:hypothetical protein